jgi:hypothetical protein
MLCQARKEAKTPFSRLIHGIFSLSIAEKVVKGIKAFFSALILIGLVLAGFNLLTYFGKLDGDPMIHARFAEMGSRGQWFRYNASEISSGVTSLFWMFLGAIGWSFAGIKGCLFLYNAFILIGWIGGAILLGALIFRCCQSFLWSIMGAVFFVGFPGIAANGLTGMENMTFAFFIFLFIYLYSLSADSPLRGKRRFLLAMVLGLVLGLQIVTRPEGGLVALAFAGIEGWRFLGTRERETRNNIVFRFLIVALSSSLVVLPAWGFHWSVTGKLLPGSGLAPMMSERRMPTSLHIVGPSWIYLRTLMRLMLYFPLLAGTGAAVYFIKRRFSLGLEGEKNRASLHSLRLSITASVLGIAFYTLISGALHVNRYTIWIVGLLLLNFFHALGVIFKLAVKNKSKILLAGVALATLWISTDQVVEGIFRHSRGDFIKLKKAKTVIDAVENRKKYTDEFLALLDRHGCGLASQPVGVLFIGRSSDSAYL